MKNFYRIMLGKQGAHAAECVAQGFLGADFGIAQDLSNSLSGQWREFNDQFIPVFLDANPGKTKIAAGLACGALWTIAAGMQVGDVVLSPIGNGRYRVGEILGGYQYVASGVLPHRRPVQWLNVELQRAEMSEALGNSMSYQGTVSSISPYADELALLIGGEAKAITVMSAAPSTDPGVFALEKHLEDFLVRNWKQTELSKDFDIYEEDGAQVGQQYLTDTGPLDILCVSKDKKTLLVIELKRGRASDAVVGQVLRYMGYVKEELAEVGQDVRGIIIALEDDQRIRRALVTLSSITFYRYEISFRLVKS
jgi:restriction system protein